MVEAAGIGLSSHFVRCRAADSFSFRFSPSFRFLENMDPPCFHCCDYTVVFSIFGGGGGNRTRVRRHCHLNIYKLVPYFKSHFLCSYGHDQKSQPALNFPRYYCRQITPEYPANRRLVEKHRKLFADVAP